MDVTSQRRSAGISNTDILAPAGGKVARTGTDKVGAGNKVVINHGDARESKFFHLNKSSVKRGDYVLRGDPIGTVGKTGGISTGEHIHWEYRTGGNVTDPNSQLRDPLPIRGH